MLLFYCRHGDPIYNPDSLTPLGKRQAEALGRRLARYGIDRVYSSTSQRAIDTAAPTCEMTKNELVQLDWTNEKYAYREMCVKTPEGKTRWCFSDPKMVELFQSEEVRALRKKWYTHPGFAETTFGDGMARVSRACVEFLEELGYKHDAGRNGYIPVRPNDERVALFAHGGFGKSFLANVLDIPYPEVAIQLDIAHSGMTVLEFGDPSPVTGLVYAHILQLSSDSHQYKEGLPTKYNNRIDI